METVSLRAMNTDVLLAAEGQTEMLAVGFEQARRFIHSSETRFTRFSEESELSALNRSAGQPGVFTARPEIARRPNERMPPGRNPVATWNVPGQVDTKSAGQRFQASPDLFEVVRLASRFFHLTRGLFDPSILPDLKRVGYDRSMEVLREQGPAPLLESLLEGERPSFSEMDLDESDQTILLPPGLALDLGGIAKGWIAEQALAWWTPGEICSWPGCPTGSITGWWNWKIHLTLHVL
jgi:thiamine biosynthesis lipoprotein ApbE